MGGQQVDVRDPDRDDQWVEVAECGLADSALLLAELSKLVFELFGDVNCCSTLFVVTQNGSDWWFNNKYKLSVHSTDTSFPFPLRLILAAWDIRWASGNLVYDWDPDSDVPVGSCTTVTASISDRGGISISGTVCPNNLGVFTLDSRRSGAQWTGTEKGTQWEVALGVQAVHSPPGAPASYASTLGLACVNC